MQTLLLQSSASGTFDGSHLTLHELSLVTTWFSDGPERQAGFVSHAALADAWPRGSGSPEDHPLHAALVFTEGERGAVAMVTLSMPRLTGGSISYSVTVREGTIPPEFGAANLVIGTAPEEPSSTEPPAETDSRGEQTVGIFGRRLDVRRVASGMLAMHPTG